MPKTTTAHTPPAPVVPEAVKFSYCALPEGPERINRSIMDSGRERAIALFDKKWINGTVLHYYFFNRNTDGRPVSVPGGESKWQTWATREAEKNIVRQAFRLWQDIGIGIRFEEVRERERAEIRIGFMRGDASWSYIGRDAIDSKVGPNERTMNFGWDLERDPAGLDTALHEIGHALGLSHEHQNPYAGIVWDEDAVYTELAGPPNHWDRERTFYNIIRKIDPNEVRGTTWDPDSIMHYPFSGGLIREPARYSRGIKPAGGLSHRDREWVRQLYPPLNEADYQELTPMKAVDLNLKPGEQRNFFIRPSKTRTYEMRTFGASDTVMVLFENYKGTLRYCAGDDDSGEDRNAYLKVELRRRRTYVLRVRLFYAQQRGATGVMVW